MRRKRKRSNNPYVVIAALSVVVLCISIIASIQWETHSSAPPDEDAPISDTPAEDVPPDFTPSSVDIEPEIEDVDEFSKHYARCLYSSHIEGSRYFLEIKNVRREGQSLESIESSGIEGEMNIHAWVRLRGVRSPNKSMLENRNRPHIKVEREQERLDMLEQQTWRLFQASETLVLSDIQIDEFDPDNGFVANIEYRIGGVDRDLASDLIADGFILDDIYARDYGDRLP